MPENATIAGQLADRLMKLFPEEAADILEAATAEEAADLLSAADPDRAAKVAGAMTPQVATAALALLAPDAAGHLVAALGPARSVPLVSRLEEEQRSAILAQLKAHRRRELEQMLSYPLGTAGSMMDPQVYTFRPEDTVDHAIRRLRQAGQERIHDVFLVDREGKLVGVVPVQALAVSEEEAELTTLAKGIPVAVPVTASQEEVAEALEEHGLVSLPVVDFEGRIQGVIRHRKLLEVFEQETSVDIQSMVGAGKEERALSSIGFSVRKRLPWLQINLATAFLAASVVGLFEATIARFTALAVLLPVVAGQSGNTGSQALAVTLRGLALREISLSHWPRVVVKEAGVGVINGISVALVTALGVYIWSRSAGLGVVICIAMVASMAIAGVTGALIPILLSAIGQDPAQSSSIILTTVTDIAGFFSFLGLATLFASLL
jgi:magnesium transporter